MPSPVQSPKTTKGNTEESYDGQADASNNSPDMKATLILMANLAKLKEQSKDSSQKALMTKYMSPPKNKLAKGQSVKRGAPKTIKQSYKRKSSKAVDSENNNSKYSKIDDWLISNTKEQKSENSTSDKCSSKKSSPEKPPVELPNVESKKHEKRNISASYIKYGVRIPSFEKMLQEQKKAEKYKKYVENLELPIFNDDKDMFRKDDSIEVDEILDCKHLSLEEISEATKRNFAYLEKICSGEHHSERHDAFFKKSCPLNFDERNLMYNTSTITFSYEQNREMIKMLEKKFGDNVPYFFKVLLPELCLKIFMDVHNMSHDEAVEYLERRPVCGDEH